MRSFVLGHIAALASDSGLLLHTIRSSVVGLCLFVCLSVYLSVCLLVTFVSPVKTAEPIEMPFGRLTHVGPGNHVSYGVKVGRLYSPSQGATRRRCGLS